MTMKLSICWYENENIFDEFRRICTDKEVFEDSYNEWRIYAAENLEKLKKEGLDPIKVNITPTEFKAWCRENGLPLDGSSRSSYAASIIQRLSE
jgi:hypothetical protein